MKELIDKNINFFDTNEKVNLHIILETMCVTQISLGNEKFYKELREIQNIISKRWLLEKVNELT